MPQRHRAIFDAAVLTARAIPDSVQHRLVAFQGRNFRTWMQYHVGQGGQPVDQIPRHAGLQTRGTNKHVHTRRMRGKKHRRLARRIPSAHQQDLFVLAQLGFHGRRPVVHATSFVLLQAFDGRPAIDRAAGDHHGAGGHASPIHQFHFQRTAAAMQRLDLERNRDVRAEFLRLHEGASSQCLPRNTGGKAQIILNAGAGAGLTAGRASIENRDRQTFGRRVHGRGQTRRAGAHDRHVVHVIGIELRQ